MVQAPVARVRFWFEPIIPLAHKSKLTTCAPLRTVLYKLSCNALPIVLSGVARCSELMLKCYRSNGYGHWREDVGPALSCRCTNGPSQDLASATTPSIPIKALICPGHHKLSTIRRADGKETFKGVAWEVKLHGGPSSAKDASGVAVTWVWDDLDSSSGDIVAYKPTSRREAFHV